MPQTPSEELVDELCKRSFLSLWSYANPIGKDGDELCDLLVVCDPDVIVFSVKETKLKSSSTVDKQRWTRKAIVDSTRQINGAEKWIKKNNRVIRSDGGDGIPFPSSDRMRLHRIAVALGGKGIVDIPQGEYGRGFVHVLEEEGLHIALQELDTITDFVNYLAEKEKFLSAMGESEQITVKREASLLAAYIHKGRSLDDITVAEIPESAWEELTAKPEFLRRKEEDRVAYLWDKLIEHLAEHIKGGTLEFDASIDDAERVVRVMARENRFSRRVLARSFEDAHQQRAGKIRARAVLSPSPQIAYVFLFAEGGRNRKARRQELYDRCLVTRDSYKERDIVIGLAIDPHDSSDGFSLDALFFQADWSNEIESLAGAIRTNLGLFAKPIEHRSITDEFPSVGGGEEQNS